MIRLAQIGSDKKVEIRELTLQLDVEKIRGAVLTARLRAELLSDAKVEASITQTMSDARLQKVKIDADATLYEQQKNAEIIQTMYRAQAEGLKLLMNAFKQDRKALLRYLFLERGLYDELSRTNAEAIKGLEPNITVWNSQENGSAFEAVRDVYQNIPPLFSVINQQINLNSKTS